MSARRLRLRRTRKPLMYSREQSMSGVFDA
jgi:hypothetical protein